MAYVPLADQDHEQELHHPHSWVEKYVWSQDHKVITIQYGGTAVLVGLVALVLSLLMRMQLGFPGTFDLIDPNAYYQSVTMHGMIMVVYMLTALLLGGFGNYMIPLMIGARDMVFPFLNMLSFWFYLLSVLILLASCFVTGGPTGAGWTLYPPQTTMAGTPGHDMGIVLMLVSLAVFVVAFTMGGLNYVTTILQFRTRGMTLMRLPLTVWGIFVATVRGLFAVPALLVSCIMMMFDTLLGTSFFMPAVIESGTALDYQGGSPILFQHLFWFFGHPEVYIIILPAFGVVSQIIPTFSRKPLFGYSSMVYATAAIAFLSFVVWAHHMFTVGMPIAGELYFMYATMLIAVPTGVKVFNWITTMYRGSLTFETPMLFSIAFVILFTFGGFTGMMLSIAAADMQYHDTYFVVAHFHYVMVAGAVFSGTAAVYYWLPKWCGRMYDETMGKVQFWIAFIGFNITFMPQHFLGLAGMPRRYADYGLQFADWNMVSSIGAFMYGGAQILFLFNVIRTIGWGKPTDDAKVWEGAEGLEWTLPTPAPYHTFATPPKVK